MAHWQESTEPWVYGKWDALAEDRNSQGHLLRWTLVPVDDWESGVFCRGPYGRKADMPETVIQAIGYDAEGIDFDSDFLVYLLEKLNGKEGK